jgi:hypothetical protein
MQDTPNPQKKLAHTNSLMEILLYDESWWALRLAVMLAVIFAAAAFGIFFEAATSVQAVLWQGFRYMLAPLAAIVGAFMLGAHYVQDIYELEKYRPAMRYMWAAMFNGVSTSFFTGVLAGVISFLYFGLSLGIIFLRIYGLAIGLIFGVWGGLVFALMIGVLFGNSFIPFLTISEGQKELEENKINLVDRMGGPGWLFIEPGNVVLMERLESPSGVLGAGRHFINRFHHIKNVISLKDQHGSPRDIKAITKDGIFVTVHDFQFRFRLDPGRRNDSLRKRTLSNPYPYSVKAAYNMTYNRSITADGTPVSWEKAVQFSIDGAITDYINNNLLDRVLFPLTIEGDPRSEISKELVENRRAGLKMYGADLLWHDIGKFDAGPAIDLERMKAWNAKWEGTATVIRAQGEAEQIVSEERGRAEGQVDMLTSILEALDDANLPENIDDNMWNIVLSRTAQVIESMTTVSKTRKQGDQ